MSCSELSATCSSQSVPVQFLSSRGLAWSRESTTNPDNLLLQRSWRELPNVAVASLPLCIHFLQHVFGITISTSSSILPPSANIRYLAPLPSTAQRRPAPPSTAHQRPPMPTTAHHRLAPPSAAHNHPHTTHTPPTPPTTPPSTCHPPPPPSTTINHHLPS